MLIKLAWRNLWRNKLRTSIVLSAMVFGLVGVTLMIGFMNGMVNNMTENVIKWQTSHLQIHQQGYQDDPDIKKTIINQPSLETFLDQQPSIQHWSSRHLIDGMIASPRSTRGITINGINIDKEALMTPLEDNIVHGQWLSPQGRHPILVSSKIALRLKLRVGSKVVLTFSNQFGEMSGAAFRVRGIFKSSHSGFDESNVFVRQADLQALSGITLNHEIAILLHDKTQLENLRSKIIATFPSNPPATNQIQSWTELQPLLATMSSTMQVSNLIMLLIFVTAMGFAIVNVLLMSVYERSCEFGVLMAVGMQKSKILLLISLESTFLGTLGATLGLLISILLISLLQITGISLEMVAEGLNAFGLDTRFIPSVPSKDYFTIFITVIIASFLAGLYPARQILKKSPVDAMSEKH